MVAVVPRRIHLWLLSVIGIFIVIVFTCSIEASSAVDNLDKLNLVNGSSTELSLEHQDKSSSSNDKNATTLLARLEKTSFKCKGKPRRLCERDTSRYKQVVVGKQKKGNPSKKSNRSKVASQSTHTKKRNSSDYTNIYLPVPYQESNESGRLFSLSLTLPTFIIFSIIQFKIISAIFLASAFFVLSAPIVIGMILFQGLLFKGTLILLGLAMMS